MPYKSEKIKIEFTEHDKRIRLTDKQKNEIIEKYKTGLLSHRDLAKMYNVSRKTIYNILHNDKYLEQLEKYKIEQHSKKYYNKDKRREYTKIYRQYKQELFLDGKIRKV